MFELKPKTGGSAFRDPYTGEEDEWYEAREIARIMDKVRDDLLAGLDHGVMMDTNGSKVGEWRR